VKSETLAERAAWDFIALEAGGFELSIVKSRCLLGSTPRSKEESIIPLPKALRGSGLLKGSPSKRSLKKS